MRGAGEETVAWRYFKRDVLPFAAMFAVECTTVSSNTLYKAAAVRGLSFYVFVCYSFAVSALLLLPLSLLFGRSKELPSAKSPLFFKIFLLGLLGFMASMAGSKGMEYSSPTLSSAISNLTPAFTFTLAVIFRFHLLLFCFCLVWTIRNRVIPHVLTIQNLKALAFVEWLRFFFLCSVNLVISYKGCTLVFF